jgi:hypothetical protein
MDWLIAALCALIAVAAILSNLELWRRSPNVITGPEGTF